MTSIAKKILVIEDDKLLQQVYFDRLVKEGFSVLQAFTGPQGLTHALNYKPDLIILDIMLPGGLNGFDVLTQLRNNDLFKKTPILVITALSDEKRTAESIGADEYIVKTNDPIEAIVVKVKSHLH